MGCGCKGKKATPTEQPTVTIKENQGNKNAADQDNLIKNITDKLKDINKK